MEGVPQRGRGRPRKYPPKTSGDFESTKYEIFFTLNERGPIEGKEMNIKEVVEEIKIEEVKIEEKHEEKKEEVKPEEKKEEVKPEEKKEEQPMIEEIKIEEQKVEKAQE